MEKEKQLTSSPVKDMSPELSDNAFANVEKYGSSTTQGADILSCCEYGDFDDSWSNSIWEKDPTEIEELGAAVLMTSPEPELSGTEIIEMVNKIVQASNFAKGGRFEIVNNQVVYHEPERKEVTGLHQPIEETTQKSLVSEQFLSGDPMERPAEEL